jgi:hypothetical protein
MIEGVFKSIKQKMLIGGIFCGLAKAFYCVNHEILLPKLHFYLTRGESGDWFSSYLTNRRQKDEVKSLNAAQTCFSVWGSLQYEVLQGSILRPLLLIIHVNDFP